MPRFKVDFDRKNDPDWHTEKAKPVLARRFRIVSSSRAVMSRVTLLDRRHYQQSVVKISYTSREGKRWGGHGLYLQRKGKQSLDKPGRGFDGENDEIDLYQRLNSWQRDGDEYMYRGFISPSGEHGEPYAHSIRDHAREVMRRIEGQMGTKLQWAGINHQYNTKGELQPHAHLVIRTIDANGQHVRLNERQWGKTLRTYSEELLTEQRGIRMERDILDERARQIIRNRWTQLDTAILKRANEHGDVHYPADPQAWLIHQERDEHEMDRLRYLSTRHHLATQTEERRWRLQPDYRDVLLRLDRTQSYSYLHRIHRDIPAHAMIKGRSLTEGERLTARVVGEGEINPYTHARYALLENGKKIDVVFITSQHPIRQGETITVEHKKGQTHVLTHAQTHEQTLKQSQEEEPQKRTHQQVVRIDDVEQTHVQKRARGLRR